jgi:predicted enzyme related to lactoylglutathione lyase
MKEPLLRKVDAVTVRVSDLESGLTFYRDALGQPMLWRNDDVGQAAVGLRDSDAEIVLTTQHGYEPNWLVDSADQAAAAIESAGGRILAPAFDVPVGRIAVVADPFGNTLVLIDLSRGTYRTRPDGTVVGVQSAEDSIIDPTES